MRILPSIRIFFRLWTRELLGCGCDCSWHFEPVQQQNYDVICFVWVPLLPTRKLMISTLNAFCWDHHNLQCTFNIAMNCTIYSVEVIQQRIGIGLLLVMVEFPFKNPSHERHWIYQNVRIVAPITKKKERKITKEEEEKSRIRATLGPLIHVWFRSTNTITWVGDNTLGVFNTMSPCLYQDSMYIPLIHVYNMSPCKFYASMSVLWVLANNMSSCL